VIISDALLREIFDAAPQDATGHPMLSAARFDKAVFEGEAGFDGATFQGKARFDGARFQGEAWFDNAVFEGDAGFTAATFKGDAVFGDARFEGRAGFVGAVFEGDAEFGDARFEGTAWFDEVTFKGEVPVLGPMTVTGRLNLDGVQFASTVRIHDAGPPLVLPHVASSCTTQASGCLSSPYAGTRARAG
jgi:uncharacterized protein YjbI with pentapeptide repeats